MKNFSRFFFSFSTLVILHFSTQTIRACQCYDQITPLIAYYSKADAVFAGKVSNVKKF